MPDSGKSTLGRAFTTGARGQSTSATTSENIRRKTVTISVHTTHHRPTQVRIKKKHVKR